MKTYKLIKTYPSLPDDWKVGMLIATNDGKSYTTYSTDYCSKWLTKYEVENHPEYWKEVFIQDTDSHQDMVNQIITLQEDVSRLKEQVKELETKLSNSQQSNSIRQQQLANMIIAEDIAREARIERQKSKEPTIFPISPFIPISDQLEKIRRQQLIKEQEESYKMNPNSKPYTL